MSSRSTPRDLLLVATLALVSACQGRERVVATELDAGTGPFGSPQLITGLLDPADALQDPTLTADELEIYFAADKAGVFDIWKSTRAAVDQPWVPATRVDELSSLDRDYEPAVSEDGLTIYVSTDQGPYFQIMVSQRPNRSAPWATPQLVTLGLTPHTDRGPTIDRSGLAIAFASSRVNGEYDLYLARRQNQSTGWDLPVPLTALNTEWQDWDPELFLDGLALAFSSRRDGDHLTTDLYESHRLSDSAPFLSLTPMTELNSPASEGDPWLSNDGRHVVFASERDGISRLYEAFR